MAKLTENRAAKVCWKANSLLLEVILTAAAGLASRERALVIALAGVDPEMPREVT